MILATIISYLQLQWISKASNWISQDNLGYLKEALEPKKPGWFSLRMVPHLEEVYRADKPTLQDLSILQTVLEADWSKVLHRLDMKMHKRKIDSNTE